MFDLDKFDEFDIPTRSSRWLTALDAAVRHTVVTLHSDRRADWPLAVGVRSLILACAHQAQRGARIFLFGNGGSLATAAHMATDFSLVGWPAIALSDPVAITSHTNDFGSAMNFGQQLELLRPFPADMCIALSCSGRSPNIIQAVSRACAFRFSAVFTFTGFAADNPLRSAGSMNFYVPSTEYGIVQLAHEAILHMACDFAAEMK